MKREINKIKKKYSEKIALVGKKIKAKKFNRRDLRGISLGRAVSVIRGQEEVKEEKTKIINEMEEKIKKISKMNVFLNILGIETVKMMMTMKKIQFQQEMMWKKK